MAASRWIYTGALTVCGLSFLLWGQWLAWVLLWCLAVFPWVSLVMSLGAIARFRAEPACPKNLTAGEWGELTLLGSCDLPVPPFRGRLRLQNLLTGQRRLYRPEAGIPTRHCGGIRVTVEKGRVCDYLGLFSFPIRHLEEGFFLILPRPVAVDPFPEMRSHPARPHDRDLRPYRPGDPLRSIHRKLSLKTGTLLLLAPKPVRQPLVLDITLSGETDPDRVLGELLWTGQRLLRRQQPFLLVVHSGAGEIRIPVETPHQLERAMERLLCTPAGGRHG